MRESSLIAVLKRLELWPLKRSGTQHFKLSCLLKEAKHARGTDDHPSATVSFDTFPSWFSCYSCETRLPFGKAVLRAALFNPGRDWARIAADIEATEASQGRDNVVGIRTSAREDQPVDMTSAIKEIIEAGGLEYPPPVVDLLLKKGVPVETARKLGWCFVPQGYENEHLTRDAAGDIIAVKADCLVFPTLTRRPDKKLICVGAQARPIEKVGSKYFTIFPYSAGFYLYGEHLLPTPPGSPFFVVEGPLDVAHLLSLNYPAGGLFGLHVTQHRAKKIAAGHSGPVFLFQDPDQKDRRASTAALTELKKRLADVRLVQWHTDPKYCSKNDLVQITGYDPP